MPRHQRLLSETGIYHVMMRGNEKKNLFLDEEDKQRFLDTLFIKKEETAFLIYAYCLMDNHVHLLLKEALLKEAPESLASIMKRINVSYVYYFNQKNHRVGHLFQDRFKSEPIEDDRQLLAVIRYIHNNPLKAGLVKSRAQYRWSSYNSYLNPYRPEAKLVDTEFVLSILANDQETAIQEFEKFSQVQDQSEFIEIKEESMSTVEQGRSYLENYLARKWSGKNTQELMNDKDTRTAIIIDLKTNTKLSVRTIADLLGINRGIVQKTKAKNDQ